MGKEGIAKQLQEVVFVDSCPASCCPASLLFKHLIGASSWNKIATGATNNMNQVSVTWWQPHFSGRPRACRLVWGFWWAQNIPLCPHGVAWPQKKQTNIEEAFFIAIKSQGCQSKRQRPVHCPSYPPVKSKLSRDRSPRSCQTWIIRSCRFYNTSLFTSNQRQERI
jgi:hypothetical protein